jgi:hypothetical protein
MATLWCQDGLEDSVLYDRDLKLLIPFVIMYCYEESFSAVVNINMKARNRLDLSYGH